MDQSRLGCSNSNHCLIDNISSSGGDRTRGSAHPSWTPLSVSRSEEENLLSGLPRSTTLFFTYSSPPRPIPHGRHRRYRNNVSRPRGVHDYYNVMWDPHVVRGTTAASTRHVDPNDLTPKPPQEEGAKEPKIRKKRSTNIFRTKLKPAESFNLATKKNRYTPSPVEGRLHSIAQTEKLFLEELIGETEESSDATVQTDNIYDMPITPLSQVTILSKTGVDAWTQVLPGELFDFESEVEPVLESLVGKLLEQAMFEVIEEEEIAALREQKHRFQETRRLEEMELRQLQAQQRRISAEKERLKKQLERESISLESEGRESKLSGLGGSGTSMYTTSYLLELLPSVLSSLRQEGFLADPMIEGDDKDYPAPYPKSMELETEPDEPDTENIPTSASPVQADQEPSAEEGRSVRAMDSAGRLSESAGSLAEDSSEAEHETTVQQRTESWNISQQSQSQEIMLEQLPNDNVHAETEKR